MCRSDACRCDRPSRLIRMPTVPDSDARRHRGSRICPERGHCACGRILTTSHVVRSNTTRRNRRAGAQSTCRATGQSKVSTTCRTTRTCRCRGRCALRRFRVPTRLGCTDARSPCRRTGMIGAPSCTSVEPRACTASSSMALSSDTDPTAAFRVSTTSHRIS